MAKKKSSASALTPIASVKHKDTRKNIPTEELRDFVVADEQSPKSVLYPRNPELDPQLVWQGKDQQDAKPLEIPVVPIYIQEKIHPQAIIEDFRRSVEKDAKKTSDDFGGLFADFNGLPADFDQRVDFYHHDGHWSNRMILGDSLMVMSSLAEKEGLKGKVQMIYFDPPYGIKFGSNWQVSTRKRDVKDGKAEDMVRQPEQIKAFRDTYELGIHSYLAYLRDRLVTARELLTESGSIFLQIGDQNVHLVRCILDEVFGAENFVTDIAYAKTTGFSGLYLSSVCDYILWYGKSRDSLKYHALYREKSAGEEGAAKYREASSISSLASLPIAHSVLATTDQVTSQGATAAADGSLSFAGRNWAPPAGLHWKTTVRGMERLGACSRLVVEGESLRFVRLISDFPVFPVTNVWLDIGGVQSRTDPKVYVVQTAVEAVKRCLLMTTDPGDLVLDPTCGSGTTAYVAEQWGRRWITTDTSRVALTLARTRIMSARYPYYILADSPEGIAKEAEVAGKFPPSPLPKTDGDPRKGFVYKRVPHVTLKAIANNEDIDVIHAKWQQQLEPLRAKLNTALKQKWEEWEIPRSADDKWPAEAKKIHSQWWELRRERQKEIDASIARKADMETLYDQPFEENKKVRVSGPFTVESLSPHRTITVQQKVKQATVPNEYGTTLRVLGTDKFGQMILDNLRTAGVQNTRKAERLKFDSLAAYAGQWIHAEGKYTDADGKEKRAAICIGPEHGTVGPELIKEAAKEAVQGVGFDLLIVCGFAFDPHVSEESKRYGTLMVLPTRINPDLAMGDLLKKTGAGNLFMVFGEPDIAIDKLADGQVCMELKGLDVYDPTTGEIRASTTDDIACWFIDTNYNGESFFVRHAYFTGAGEPYDKLKRALRAEVDEAAWSALYSTRSRAFDRPATGKIAIKVINHYGDEVIKICTIE